MGEAPASEEDGPHGLASASLRQGVADVPQGGRHSLQRPQDTLAKISNILSQVLFGWWRREGEYFITTESKN